MESPSDHRYEILATLGRGGFGTVYRARFLGEGGFEKQVAIKILNHRMEGIEDVASRLRDEARMLGLLDHRAIVRVDRLVRLGGRWAVVMEYIRGVELGGLLETGPVPVHHALEIAAEVASALADAYEGLGPDGAPLGLVHRDIKPDNIYVTAAGEVKVLDFGIARAEFSRREAYTSDLRFGSPSYMAPERFDQSQERPDESSTDVYSLGAVLYEMVLGEPFGRTSPIESRHKKFEEERLAKLRRARCPDGVIDLITRMLAYERSERPTSRAVEKRCLELMEENPGPRLRVWAGERVPPLVREGTELTGEITRFVDEDGTAAFNAGADSLILTVDAPRAVTAPTTDRKTAAAGLAGVLLLVVLASVGGGFVASALVGPTAVPVETEPLPVPATPPSPAPEAAPTPATGTATDGEADPEAASEVEPEPAEPAPAPAPSARPSPQPSSGQVAEAPAADAPHGQVKIAGDARRVVLVGVRERFAVPGRVPPGRYTVAADFGTGSLVALDAVTVQDGDVVNLRCDGLLETCARY